MMMMKSSKKDHQSTLYFGIFIWNHKNKVIYIYKFVKSSIDKNNNVCDVTYITTYTNLLYH